MCNFLSAIITKNDVFYDFDIDSHEELIKKHGLNDKTKDPDFVRVEYVPEDVLDDKKPWAFRTDQDFKPEWYSEKWAEKQMQPIRKLFYKERVIKNAKETFKIEKGNRWYIFNSKVVARGNSTVDAWDNSKVDAWDNSKVDAWDNSKVDVKDDAICKRRYEIIVANKDYKLVYQK